MIMGFRERPVEKIKNKCITTPIMYQKITRDELILNVRRQQNNFFKVQYSTNTYIYYTGSLFNPCFALRYTSTFHDNCSTTEGFKDIKPKIITNRKCDSFDRKVKESFSFKFKKYI